MNKMIALMLAASASALLAATPAYAQDASYKSLTDKASADYKQAKAACDAHSGNAKKVCVEEAKVARAKAACVTRNAAGSTKTAVADSVITTKIKADLVKDNDLKALDVHVETVNGVVMLSGFVPSQAQVKKAADLARGVEGVTDVKNGLKVK
ncbi:BON domain-containing protein [Janthinobacterium sp. EB271-G4-7A]|uniref:BON domain-containing protein n=1 Tax=Janthinobacterium sp. EB271-G4-7A TaxID=2775056 RepID=UPI001E57D25A|nr:BON domain-containing protein [Janthinobacterium sp. EB271-G4-7A]MCC7695756.1 BON domain-containing protein [Janthinobacterium sp. EB271-G4-7A]